MSLCKVIFCICVAALRRHFGQRKGVSVRGCEKGLGLLEGYGGPLPSFSMSFRALPPLQSYVK